MDATPLSTRDPFRVETLTTQGFRNLEDAEVPLGPGLTVVFGPNGAGKTNLLEAVYFALAGCSCRTANDRELVSFGGRLARAELDAVWGGEHHRFLAAVSAAQEGRRHLRDGVRLARAGAEARPPVSVFMPDRLALVKGPPRLRRAHLDRLVAALWPGRDEARAGFARALAQRNALLPRIRAGVASSTSLDAWDLELAAQGSRLMEARAQAVELLAQPFAQAAAELELPGEVAIGYRPRSEARSAEELAAELGERRARDVERGRTTHGPQLDEVELSVDTRSARRYGSQGQQRATLLALLFGERELLLRERESAPLMLLDDVMSELDPRRRELLLARLRTGGQALLTATHLGQLPDVSYGGERDELRLEAGRAMPAPRAVSAAGVAA